MANVRAWVNVKERERKSKNEIEGETRMQENLNTA